MPRIYDNGTYRDMTTEEIEELENQSSGGAELLEEGWRLIQDITLEENTTSIDITTNTKGESFELKEVIAITTGSVPIQDNIALKINGKGAPNWSYGGANTIKTVFWEFLKVYDNVFKVTTGNPISGINSYVTSNTYRQLFEYGESITSLRFYHLNISNYFIEGSRFIVYGR